MAGSLGWAIVNPLGHVGSCGHGGQNAEPVFTVVAVLNGVGVSRCGEKLEKHVSIGQRVDPLELRASGRTCHLDGIEEFDVEFSLEST